MDDATAWPLLAEAVTAYHSPRRFDAGDITTWSAAQLDELALFAVAGIDGVEVDWLGVGQVNAEHGVNTVGETR